MNHYRPYVICLCGSTKFRDEFIRLNKELTDDGFIVLSVGSFGHADGIEHTKEKKAQLDVLHLRKIEISDYIVVVNVDGYIGESTQREIEFGRSIGISSFYWWWTNKELEPNNEYRNNQLYLKHVITGRGVAI